MSKCEHKFRFVQSASGNESWHECAICGAEQEQSETVKPPFRRFDIRSQSSAGRQVLKTLYVAKAALENGRRIVQKHGSEDDANLNHDALYHINHCLRAQGADLKPLERTEAH